MITQLKSAIYSLKSNSGSWFESNEFGRICLNAGFELTVRDRLLENLHLEFQKINPNYSIVSEYSKHGEGCHKRADMALLEGSLCGKEITCEGIFEIKTNFSTQFNSDIKSRLAADWSKWNNWVNKKPSNKLCIMYIIVDITPDEPTECYFAKYTRVNKIDFQEIENHFVDFARNKKGTYSRLEKAFQAYCLYPGCEKFNISTSFLFMER